MREYGQIQCSFWHKGGEEDWDVDMLLLGAYLLTSPHSNGIGVYRLPIGYVCDDLGWTQDRAEKGFQKLSAKGFCNRFGTVVMIPKFLRWNPIPNANVAKKRQKDFESVPNTEAKEAAAQHLRAHGNHWSNGFINRLETLSERYTKQERRGEERKGEDLASNDAMPEQTADAANSGTATDALYLMPMSGKPAHPLHQSDVDHFRKLFPGLDVDRSLVKIRAWLEANGPKRSKGVPGLKKRITTWLTKDYDDMVRQKRTGSSVDPAKDAAEAAIRMREAQERG